MSEEKEQRSSSPFVRGWASLGRLIIIFAIIPAVIIIGTGCKKKPAEPTRTEQHQHEPAQSEPVTQPPSEPRPSERGRGEPAEIDPQPAAGGEVSLNNIIRAAKTWRPAYTHWYGKPAPDFTLADLAGKEHKLSDYRGKNVLLIFWATWCPPCRREIPGLIELRKTVGEDKLTMLAISNEAPTLVKKFVTDQKMNYTVLLDKGNMPKPFGVMRIYTTTGIPCSFFINPEGKIKLATSGLISFGEIKAVLQAS